MRHVLVAMLTALVAANLAGCKLTGVASKRRPFEILNDRAKTIIDAGGLAAVGIGTSRSTDLAKDKAKTRGRTELAHMIEVRVDSMMKDFQEEVEPTTDVAPLFRADKSFRCGRHPPSVPLAMEHHTDAESGTTTAWALMVQDPKVIAEPMADQKHPAKDLYTRFRASQAFAELKDEVRRFKEFKSKNRKMFQSWDH